MKHQTTRRFTLITTFMLIAALLSGCFPESPEQISARATVVALSEQMAALQGDHSEDMGFVELPAGAPADAPAADVVYTLTTGSEGTSLVFIGVGGEIDGVVNPTLTASPGQTVQIRLVNGQPVEHDLRIDEFDVETGSVFAEGEEAIITFHVMEGGVYTYYCSIPGHRAAGMEGLLQVGATSSDEAAGVSVIQNPANLPGPLGDRGPELVQVELTARELEATLADGTTYKFFTFDGVVPGPFIRARVGDTIEITLNNASESAFIHSIDLHSVTGPGGGAVHTQVQPGESKVFTFQALNPGIYVYHCATASHAHHIQSGMYGLILIEPEGGLPPVDREFYVMQGEVYTAEPYGTPGLLTFDHEAMLDERPEYFIFNGAAAALTTEENGLHAEVGETVRIFFGVAGPNFTSSFHVIGEIFDRVYSYGSITSPPVTDVQTVSVAPGGATIVEFEVQVPGTYILVDHALSRLERGLVGLLFVSGEDKPGIFSAGPANP